jgi:hypothetical protein
MRSWRRIGANSKPTQGLCDASALELKLTPGGPQSQATEQSIFPRRLLRCARLSLCMTTRLRIRSSNLFGRASKIKQLSHFDLPQNRRGQTGGRKWRAPRFQQAFANNRRFGRRCNSEKGSMTAEEFVRQRQRTQARSHRQHKRSPRSYRSSVESPAGPISAFKALQKSETTSLNRGGRE